MDHPARRAAAAPLLALTLVLATLVPAVGSPDPDQSLGADPGAASPATLARVQELESALARTPDDPRLLAEYGAALVRAKRATDGLAALDRAMVLAPDEPAIALELARAHAALAQHARAAAVAVQVAQSPLASDAERSEGYYIAGNARAKLGEREDAERLFRAAVDADSKNAKALMNLGVLLYSSDRESEGISSLMLAAKRANDDPRLLIRIADVLDATGRTEMALPMRKRTVELLPAEPDAHIVYARALMNARMIEEAAAELQRAVELAPENGYAHVSLAQVLLLSERFDEAEAHAKRARELGQTEAEGVITQVEEWRALSSQGSSRPR